MPAGKPSSCAYTVTARTTIARFVPKPGESRGCEAGRCLIFDDTYRHRVQNNADQPRVVLFLDIKRPMNAPGILINNIVPALIRRSPLIREAVRNQAAWQAEAAQSGDARD